MWTLLLSRQGDPSGSFLDRRQIDSGQIKVGRGAATCDLVVPDTSGQISREHCVISAIGFDLFVVDTSTNGVALNQPTQRIAPQTPVGVRIGDRLLLGDFVIEVASEAAGLSAQLHAPAALAPAAASFQQPDAWFDTGAAADPFWGGGPDRQQVHDFLSDAMHDFLAVPAPATGGLPGGGFDPFGGALGEAFSKPLLAQPIEAAPAAFAIPEDWAAPARPPLHSAPDPFASQDPFAGSPSTAAPDPFGGLSSAAAPEPFGGSPAVDAPDPFAGFASPPMSVPVGLGDMPGESSTAFARDPFADFGIPPSAAPVSAPDPFAGFAAAPTQATSPPRPIEADAPPVLPAAPAVGAGGAPDWGDFCEGAGLDPGELRTSPAAMRRLGVLYRQVVLGLSDLIQDRAAFKDEFRVERTQLSFGRNNPLKHLQPLESAKLLLGDPLPGFMDAEEAVRAGLEDVKRHQLALLAGVQHALKAVFERLSPTEVERVMKTATAKRGFLGRGVDPWAVYRTMWEALRTDAASNVNSVMSVAFREGYEAFLKNGKGAA